MAYVIPMSPLSRGPSTSAARIVKICRSRYHNRLAHRAIMLFQERLYLLRFASLILSAPACADLDQEMLRSDSWPVHPFLSSRPQEEGQMSSFLCTSTALTASGTGCVSKTYCEGGMDGANEVTKLRTL